jgi:iron complex transport system ATP-binding protein
MTPSPEITGQSLLSLKDLSIGYGSSILLSNLNLELHVGELVCFMGPNGVGKSSLIKTLIGLHQPIRGEIDFRDKGPLEKVVSVVLTDRINHPQLKVHELIALGRYPHLDWRLKLGVEDDRIIETAIQQARIQHLYNSRVAELSDGQMQMVMIARALAQDTRILLLDEPTAHLDLNNRVEIMNLLKKLTRETNRAILIATHELDLALQTADVVWIAGTNKSVKTGIPEDLVLDGSFDSVFQFKGYDLKTGKVAHDPFRKLSVSVKGEGYSLLWTRNALERNGYSVAGQSQLMVEVISDTRGTGWRINGSDFQSLKDLLHYLGKLN